MTSAVLPLDFKRLEQLYAAGLHDGFIDTALRKVLARQIERDEADLARLDQMLIEYEALYSMKSENFWERFKAGNMDDTADFMEWNALCRSRERLLARLRILKGETWSKDVAEV